jgi:anti-sigma factor RsiW
VLRFEGSAHQQAQRLLPWWVNGTLEGSEFESVSQHLAQCAQCRREVEELHQLRVAYAQTALPMSLQPAFARLRRRVQAQDRPAPLRWAHWRDAWTLMPNWLRGIVVAQGLAIALLGGLLLGGTENDRERDRPVATYRTLGRVEAPVGDAERLHPARAQLVVMFDPATSQAQMQELLRVNEARIVEGPNDAGAYVIAVPAARATTVREALRAAPQVVLAEPLDTATGR